MSDCENNSKKYAHVFHLLRYFEESELTNKMSWYIKSRTTDDTKKSWNI